MYNNDVVLCELPVKLADFWFSLIKEEQSQDMRNCAPTFEVNGTRCNQKSPTCSMSCKALNALCINALCSEVNSTAVTGYLETISICCCICSSNDLVLPFRLVCRE